MGKKMTAREVRRYAIERLTDGAPHMIILDELTTEMKIAAGIATKEIAKAKEMIARNFDEPDYQLIRACAFAGDSYKQELYRQRIDSLQVTQEELRAGLYDDDGEEIDTETRLRLILACDRSMQGWATLALRGRRDLPVAFAPKGVLQNQEPPTYDEIDDAIDGAL